MKRPRVNNVEAYLSQVREFWFNGPQARFAREAGLSESTHSRIIRGKTTPRYADILRIVRLLEKKLDRKIDPRDVYDP